jgi:protein-tyrosine phosphatase
MRLHMIKVLFVCTGNICRSPTADGVLRAKIAALGLGSLIEVDSAGTSGFHAGEAPDARSQRVALRYGYDLSALVARQVKAADFITYDYLFALDAGHEKELLQHAPAEHAYKVKLFLPFVGMPPPHEVPDPYYGGEDGFEAVLSMLESGCAKLIDKLLDEMENEDGCVSHGACGCAR